MAMIFYVPFIMMVVCVVGAFLKSSDGESGPATVLGVVAALLCVLTIFWTAPYHFGYGHVTSVIEELDTRLDDGATYQRSYFEGHGTSYLVVVKVFGTYKTMAIRTNTVPPELFVMVDGKPVAIQK